MIKAEASSARSKRPSHCITMPLHVLTPQPCCGLNNIAGWLAGSGRSRRKDLTADSRQAWDTIEGDVPLRRGKQVCFDDLRADYRELEAACKRPGRRRHGQVWHQTCPGFRHLDSHPAQNGERDQELTHFAFQGTQQKGLLLRCAPQASLSGTSSLQPQSCRAAFFRVI